MAVAAEVGTQLKWHFSDLRLWAFVIGVAFVLRRLGLILIAALAIGVILLVWKLTYAGVWGTDEWPVFTVLFLFRCLTALVVGVIAWTLVKAVRRDGASPTWWPTRRS